jgi:hypothetical protein
VRPNLDSLDRQQEVVEVTKGVHHEVVLEEDLAVGCTPVAVVVAAVKSISPTFVISFPFLLRLVVSMILT